MLSVAKFHYNVHPSVSLALKLLARKSRSVDVRKH